MTEHRNPLDPPTPVPSWLWPQPGTLGEYDMRLTATARELYVIGMTLAQLGLADANVMLTQRDGSPWLEIAAVPALEPVPFSEAVRVDPHALEATHLALWRYTCAVYRVGPDGAVEDDPIARP